uniref:EOG090X07V0 n=1 Tax=Daphnia pulex TaxID=6669 RepID=A0A4Y7MUS1_DAPPU|nr:EOG090X07V0 [Daphnia pulex]
MDRSGVTSANSYLRGVSVKISEKYRPPRRPTLPPGLCFEPSPHLFSDNIDLIDEVSALKLIASMRDLHTQETTRRKQSVSAFLESQAAVDEKEIEEITSDLSLNSLTNNIPSLSVLNLQARNGQLLQHTQASMEVLTPIQSSTVEIKKKENMSAINLAEFESYSTNPFEEMELKTLNDKEELAMLLQPSPQPSYGLQYQNYNPSTIPSWTENRHQPVRQYEAAANWIPNESSFFSVDKLSHGNIAIPVEFQNQAISHKNLRQAKSVPDLSDVSFGTGETPINKPPFTGVTDKRLSSRTPPPRLTSDSIKRPVPKPNFDVASPYERKLNAIEKRLVQQLQDMGFVRENAVRAIARLGANEKDVVDQLLLIQKLEESGHSIERIETALDVLKPCKELPTQLEHHLVLVDQLSALGFEHGKISSALVAAGHDRDKALDILLLK